MITEQLVGQGALVLVSLLSGWFTYAQATKVARIAAEHTDRAALTDDLQEEVTALRVVVGETRTDADSLRLRLRLLMEYLDVCLALLRRHDIEPPPVPAMARRPWEGPS
jgi:tRNA C32,U32 (ribose-2'-O)-methylase TrmJ